MELLHAEMTGLIRQTAFDLHKYFRNGFLEKVYENALAHRLRKAGFHVQQQAAITVRDEDGSPVGEYFADLLVNGFLIIETKAVKAITDEHLAQLMNYLKATGHTLGLLINFGEPKLVFKRVLYTENYKPQNT